LVDKPRANPDHATVKPLALPACAIANHTDQGDLVYDNFLGSGTTLVACERLGRKGRGIEISPAYVAVSLERLSQMGLKPKLVST
jgi:DNA modification methylase